MTVDDVRRFWDERPCNIRHSRLPVGSQAYWMEVDARRRRVEPHIGEFMQSPRWKGQTVLEVGCGIGSDTTMFLAYGARVRALDLSMTSVDLAEQHVHTMLAGTVDVSFRVHDVEQPIPWLEGQPPDLIYSFGVLHHTPDPGRALRNLRDVAGQHTELRIMLYHRYATKVLGILVRTPPWRWRGAVARHSEAQQGSPVTHTYSRRGARRLLQEAGWEVESVTCRHIFPYRWRDYVEYRYVKRILWRLIPPRFVERVLGWHLLIVARPEEDE